MGEQRKISATEANRRFSEVLRQVDHGDTYIVTSHGREVAKISHASEADVEIKRRAAREAHLARLRARPALNIPRTWKREDLYD